MKTDPHMQLHKKTLGGFIGDMVYGASDGIVTTFAVVASVAGAGLSPLVVLALGFANLLADGWSMASGNYLGTKSRRKYESTERSIEEEAIRQNPQDRMACLKDHYRAKGVDGEVLDKLIEVITRDEKLWVDEMLACELDIKTETSSKPIQHAAATFAAFVVFGLVPLLPYLFRAENPFTYSIVLTAIAFFTVGSTSSKVTGANWLFAGLQMFIIGSLAGVVAYGVGFIVKGMIGVSI